MSLVDLLVTILVATILITVGIGLMTYLVYKLRHARVREEDGPSDAAEGRYFVPYEPPSGEAGEGLAGDAGDAGAGESAAEARGS